MGHKKEIIPEVDKAYHFFDDGKIRESRHSIAKVIALIPFDEFRDTHISPDMTLYDAWARNVDNSKLYSEETDYAVKARIPLYDEDPIYFVRDKEGGWFSIDTTNCWQSGILDVSGRYYRMLEEEQETLYAITLTREQLVLISNAVEDWSRFISGQTGMDNAVSILDDTQELRESLRQLPALVVPELHDRLTAGNDSYPWNGGDCPNERQRKAIAMSYGIYREIRHFLAVEGKRDTVYSSPTLTCEEQGRLVTIEKKEQQDTYHI